MDEWLNMNPSVPGSCGDFLNKHFLSHVNFKEDHVRLFDGMAEDKTAECASVKALIEICWNQIFHRCSTINRRHHHRIKRNLRIKKCHSDRIWRPQTGNH